MIYNMESALGLNQTEADWQDWYAEMKPLSGFFKIPGFLSAQRFRGITAMPSSYFAVYSVESRETMGSDSYKAGGGGTFGSPRFKPLITFWHRNLFDGPRVAPAVDMETSLLAVMDATEPKPLPPVLNGFWTTCVALDMTTPHRAFAVIDRKKMADWPASTLEGLRLYQPLTPQLTS
jgi:hypothetical protein